MSRSRTACSPCRASARPSARSEAGTSTGPSVRLGASLGRWPCPSTSTPRRSAPTSTRGCSRSASRSPRSASLSASRSARRASRVRRRSSDSAAGPPPHTVSGVRSDPERLRFEITARDGAARSGRLHTAHGTVDTPAFIPLATRGSVRSLTAAEVAELGYELVLGNTFHLRLSPGPDRIAALGGLRRFMGWSGATITDSGGFQVFSLGHGIDLFDCAVPTRLARHGMALAPRPQTRFRLDLRGAEFSEDEGPLVDGCSCPACGAHSRAYVHYLSRIEELTGVRLLVLHNLAYTERLVRGARESIGAGALAGYRHAVLAGAAPWEAAATVGEELATGY